MYNTVNYENILDFFPCALISKKYGNHQLMSYNFPSEFGVRFISCGKHFQSAATWKPCRKVHPDLFAGDKDRIIEDKNTIQIFGKK